VVREVEANSPKVGGNAEQRVRVPAEAADVLVRLEALEARAEPGARVLPSLDDDGLLHVGDAWRALSVLEEKLARALLADFGHAVPASTLLRALEREHAQTVRQPISRLRHRIGPLGLRIDFVPPRSYSMDFASRADDAP
jgi:hypothetical protein